LPVLDELRIARAIQPLSEGWREPPVEPRGSTLLGISFRSPQVDALGLEPRATLAHLLVYPFQLVRLGAYWSRLESATGQFVPDELDWQIEAAERAGKQIIVCVGAIKTFGYPEFFVPHHRLLQPLREGRLVRTAEHRALLQSTIEFETRIVERYRERAAVVAWQVEHESVDPLGLEHSWRMASEFVEAEVAAVRRADADRPVLLNGFLPTSSLVALQQWWRTRDQGDSLAFAARHADIVGVDYYPCHGLVSLGPWTAYLDGSRSAPSRRLRTKLFAEIAAAGRRLMVSEGQAEPWETRTNPPDPPGGVMFSCPPERLVVNYNDCMRWLAPGPLGLDAYLFWGAEYWVLRDRHGDPRYLRAFSRVLERST
jgi:hypothetical protein